MAARGRRPQRMKAPREAYGRSRRTKIRALKNEHDITKDACGQAGQEGREGVPQGKAATPEVVEDTEAKSTDTEVGSTAKARDENMQCGRWRAKRQACLQRMSENEKPAAPVESRLREANTRRKPTGMLWTRLSASAENLPFSLSLAHTGGCAVRWGRML